MITTKRTTEQDEMHKQITKETAVAQARSFNHSAIFAASLGSLPATVEAMRKRRDEWMRVARGEIRHPFWA